MDLIFEQKILGIHPVAWIPEKLNFVPLFNHGYYSDNVYENEEDNLIRYNLNLYSQLFENYKIETKDKTLLDIGCCYGRGTDFIKKKYGFSTAYGIDLIPAHVKFAEQQYNNIKPFVFDAKNLNYLDLKVDVVISIESIYYFEEYSSFYEGLYKVLKDDGVAMISCYFHKDHLNNVLNNFKRFFDVKIMDITENAKRGCVEQFKLVNEISKKYNLSTSDSALYKKILFDLAKRFLVETNNKVVFLNLYLRKHV